jgi:hypothetical protein
VEEHSTIRRPAALGGATIARFATTTWQLRGTPTRGGAFASGERRRFLRGRNWEAGTPRCVFRRVAPLL